MNHPNEEYGKDIMDMISSLNAAIRASGGTELSLDRIRYMSVEDLILLLAPNRIRFVYEKKVEPIRHGPFSSLI